MLQIAYTQWEFSFSSGGRDGALFDAAGCEVADREMEAGVHSP
jgi:hypothetical protein